jgi:hypothetical protein
VQQFGELLNCGLLCEKIEVRGEKKLIMIWSSDFLLPQASTKEFRTQQAVSQHLLLQHKIVTFQSNSYITHDRERNAEERGQL